MKGAIFDMDGLLIDSERLYQETWHAMAAEVGVTLDDSFAPAICGTVGETEERIVAQFIPGVEPKSFIAEVNRRTQENQKNYVPLKPGAREILRGMHDAGWRIAVASSSSMEMIRHNLDFTDLIGYFNALVTGVGIPRGKPAPDIFLRAAAQLHLPPEDCWVFEDSLNGVRAGLAAGCRTVMIPDIVPAPEDFYGRCAGIWPDLLTAWNQIKHQDLPK